MNVAGPTTLSARHERIRSWGLNLIKSSAMNILVVGSGGREHTLAWKLLRSQNVQKVFCIAGNGGTALLKNCENLPATEEDFPKIAHYAKEKAVSFVVVGPEAPLAGGIRDFLEKEGIAVFGPTKAGAKIEASKWWAKRLMREVGIPTAQGEIFTDAAKAKRYISEQGAPIVVKADGLAGGKGVTVAETIEEAHSAIDALFAAKTEQVVVEECLSGEEVSVLAITDGITIRPLLPAQDHKRIGEGDTGKNTGGMGAYSPAPIMTPELLQTVTETVLEPTIKGLRDRAINYQGVLYAGLMITPQGEAKVLEFNCRFGDPETQAVLPLLETPLDEIILACLEKRLHQLPPFQWSPKKALCVVAASEGYPGAYEKGKAITGFPKTDDVLIFQAGTCLDEDGKLVTSGGRVLGVTGLGDDFDRAAENAYKAIAQIHFSGLYYRSDIGYRVRNLD